LHPDNFRKGEVIAHEYNGLGYGGVKIIREMHRKIKNSLELLPAGRQVSFFCFKTNEAAANSRIP
jgi:hypothetical protein